MGARTDESEQQLTELQALRRQVKEQSSVRVQPVSQSGTQDVE